MRQRPRELLILAVVLVAIAASFPIQVMLHHGYSPFEVRSVLAGLAPLNWLVIVVGLVHAALVLQASRYVFGSTAVFLFAVAWNNWVMASFGLNASWFSAVISLFGAVGVHYPLMNPRVKEVIFAPNLRWWRTPERRKASLRSAVRLVTGGELHARTFDLSTGGAFIQLESAAWHQSPKAAKGLSESTSEPLLKHLRIGTRCTVKLVLDPLHVVQCGAEIVRHSDARGNYPPGFAVRFICLEEQQRRLLAQFVRGGRSHEDDLEELAA